MRYGTGPKADQVYATASSPRRLFLILFKDGTDLGHADMSLDEARNFATDVLMLCDSLGRLAAAEAKQEMVH